MLSFSISRNFAVCQHDTLEEAALAMEDIGGWVVGLGQEQILEPHPYILEIRVLSKGISVTSLVEGIPYEASDALRDFRWLLRNTKVQ